MEVTIGEISGAPLMQPVGKIDTTTAGDFEAALKSVLDGGPTKLAIDFTGVSYISSAGLRVMLMAAKKMRPIGGKVVLYGMSDQIREVFQISGFAAMFTIAASADAAATELA